MGRKGHKMTPETDNGGAQPDANGWYPIESAPKELFDGRLVSLKSDDLGGYESPPLGYNAKIKKWVGKTFGLIGMTEAYWDTQVANPTHIRPLGPPPVGAE